MIIASGQVLTDLNNGHAGTDVLRFFRQIEAAAARGLSVHVVLDNLSAHSTRDHRMAARRHSRRCHLYFTRTPVRS
jgi:hypothetical protein